MQDFYNSHDNQQSHRSVESIISEGYTLNVTRNIQEGFSRFGKEAGIYVAFTLVYIALVLVANAIPFVGDVANTLVSSPLAAGFICYGLAQRKNEFREFSTFFGGFNKSSWLHLVLQGILVNLAMLLAVAIAVLPFFWNPLMEFITNADKISSLSQEQAGEYALTLFNPSIIQAAILSAIILVSVMTLFSLAPFFIVYRGYSAMEAVRASYRVVSKKYFAFIGLNFLLWLILSVGFLMCCVGILVALPVYFLSMAAAYEEVTGD
jgi:hypothetical protein